MSLFIIYTATCLMIPLLGLVLACRPRDKDWQAVLATEAFVLAVLLLTKMTGGC